jgi:hypothetical protein
MSILVLRAYFWLVWFDGYLAREDFPAVYNKVRNCALGSPNSAPDLVARICSAIDVACIWYWKEVLCLQRDKSRAPFKTAAGNSDGSAPRRRFRKTTTEWAKSFQLWSDCTRERR